MCEIAWNIGQHCLFACIPGANSTARSFSILCEGPEDREI